MNKKGFTLIELLAVIIILGIVLLIAVPSVSRIINDTRKSAYVDIANTYVDEVRKQIQARKIELKKDGTTYYIPTDIIKLETGTNRSPFGEWATVSGKVHYLAFDDDTIDKCNGEANTPAITASGSDSYKIYNNKLSEYDSDKEYKKVTQACMPSGSIHEAYVIVRYDKVKQDYVYSWSSRDVTGHYIAFENAETLNEDDVILKTQPILKFNSITKTAISTSNPSKKTVFNYDEVTARSGFANGKVALYYHDRDLTGGSAALHMSANEAHRCFVYYFVTETTIGIEDYDVATCGTDVQIPSTIDGYTVTEIGSYAFYNKGLTSVTIYDGIQTIGSSAFRNNHISVLYLPNAPISIGSWAFYSNDLTEINLPKNTTASGGAFSGNNIPEENAFIYRMKSDGTVDYTYLSGYAGERKQIVIPPEKNGVPLKTIGSQAFRSLGVTSISVPDSVETIESWALAGNSFTTFVWPSHLKTIGGAAFTGCNLTVLDIPSTVTSIGNRSFNKCKVPKGGENEFVYARNPDGSVNNKIIVSYAGANKQDVVIPDGVTTINGSAFLGVGLKGSLTIPNSVTSIGIEAFNANSVTGANEFIYARKSGGGPDYTKIIGYAGGERANVIVPNTVKIIGNQTFGEDSIKGVTLPEGLEKIETNAFRYNYLTEITIPSTVTSIDSRALCKEVSWGKFNRLTKIVNKTGKSFNWASITCSKEAAKFPTGTVNHQLGAFEVTAS